MKNLKSNVFCPNCGAKNKIEQNFCRFCGLNLQETSKSLAAQLSFGKNAGELKHLQLIKKTTDYATAAIIIICSIAAVFFAYFMLNKMGVPGGKVFGVFMMLSMLFQFVMRHVRRIKRNKVRENNAESDLSLQKETAKLLEEKPFAPASSITENSTRLLFTENKTRKLS